MLTMLLSKIMNINYKQHIVFNTLYATKYASCQTQTILKDERDDDRDICFVGLYSITGNSGWTWNSDGAPFDSSLYTTSSFHFQNKGEKCTAL